jgi:predicted glutamine amidotransferase
MLADAGLVGEYSAANLLIASGERLFAFRRFRRDGGYYTLYALAGNGTTAVASQPPDGEPGWRLMENGELLELAFPESRSILLAGMP